MKKSLLVLLLVLAASPLFAQQSAPPTTPAAGQPAAPAGQAAAAQQKVIKDPAEYNAYVTAVNQTDPNAKAQAFEAFLQQYPNSVMKPEGLEALMGAYQQLGNLQKVGDTADRLLQASPNNVRALFVLAYLHRTQAETPPANVQQNPAQAAQYVQQQAAQAREFGQRGLQAVETWAKPQGMSDQEYTQQKQQMTVVMDGAVGFGALQQKDYATAAKYLQAAIDAGPTSPINNGNIYPLAIAYLEQQPINPTGLWYVAKAAALTNNNPAVVRYGKAKYIKYHGSDQGWEQLLQQARATPTIQPPAGWTVAPAPTPAEQAAKLVATKPVAQMSFDEFQLILTSGNQQAATQVWDQIKSKPIAFEAKVIDADKARLLLAATAEDIAANKADVELTMAGPIPANLMPKIGEMEKVQGNPQRYDVSPFLIHMTNGAFIGKRPAAAKPPAKRPPARRRPPR